MRWSVLVLLLAAGCAVSPRPDVDAVPVESWERVGVDEFNARVEGAVADGAAWPASPLSVALELLDGDAGARHVTVDQRRNRAEAADTTTVVIARDGLLDDSVRGDWHRIVLRRLPDWTWRVHEARRAFRCQRGHHLESYSSEWCP
jgi:hypothetical protein